MQAHTEGRLPRSFPSTNISPRSHHPQTQATSSWKTGHTASAPFSVPSELIKAFGDGSLGGAFFLLALKQPMPTDTQHGAGKTSYTPTDSFLPAASFCLFCGSIISHAVSLTLHDLMHYIALFSVVILSLEETGKGGLLALTMGELLGWMAWQAIWCCAVRILAWGVDIHSRHETL